MKRKIFTLLTLGVFMFAGISAFGQCPANVSVGTDDLFCSAVVNYTPPLGGVLAPGSEDYVSGHAFPTGTTTVYFNDILLGVPLCSFNVTVTDDEAPAITCPAGIDGLTLSTGTEDCLVTLAELGTPVVSDNCDTDVAVTTNLTGPFGPGGPYVLTYTATDDQGLSSDCTVTFFVVDDIAPVITCPADIVDHPNDAGKCGATIDPGTATATDNCDASPSIAGVRDDGLGLNEPYPVGTTIITWTATDHATTPNSASCVQTITVLDNEPPVITCPLNQVDLYTDAGLCTATVVPGQATATDNCGLAAEPVGSRDDGLSLLDPYPFGTVVITWTVTDIHDNTSTCEQTITVSHITTVTEVDIDPVTKQYSDLVTFTATVTPWNCSGFNVEPGDATGTVEFFIISDYGTQSMGTAEVLDGVATLTDVPLLEEAGTDPPYGEGVLSPGMKDVKAVFTSTNANYVDSQDTDEDLLTVTPEDANVEYVGVTLQATPALGETSADVVLIATIQEGTTVDGERVADDTPGDIRNACITFYANGNPISDAIPVTEFVYNGDITLGVVTYTHNFSTGGYTIEAKAGCYYTGSDEAALEVYEPEGDFITGGGYIIPTAGIGENSYGLIGSNDLKWNYGYNIKYNPKGKKLQGHVNIITRTDEGRVFQIKSNAMASLGVNIADEDNLIGVYTAKASLYEVTGDLDVEISGNLLLKMTTTDRGEPGIDDAIGITLWSMVKPEDVWIADELLLSSQWDGMQTEEQIIAGGNLVVHAGASFDVGDDGGDDGDGGTDDRTNNGKKKSGSMNVDGVSSFNIYPNPFSEKVLFEFVAESNSRAILNIYNVNGQMVETLIDKNAVAGEEFRIVYKPGSTSNAVFFYTLTIDNQVRTGKILHNR